MTRRDAVRRGRKVIIVWATGAFVLGLASGIYPWLMVVVFAITVVAGVTLMRIRCEACGHPVFQREAAIAGARFADWSPIVTARCGRCGAGAHEKGVDGESAPEWIKRVRVALIFLIIVNLIGGIGLARRVDERFVWVAIVVPAICL